MSNWIPRNIMSRSCGVICSHRVANAWPIPFIAVSGERKSWAAAAMIVSSTARRPSRRWRSHSNRHTVAAAARFSDSARPRIGTRTVASASDATSFGSPHASLPNTNVTGSDRSCSYRSASPSASMARMRIPRDRRTSIASSVRRPRTTGRWNSEPADARTVLALYTSTDDDENTTAFAPTASADRSTVPAFPGSRTSCRSATQAGLCGTTSSETSTNEATPTNPCGVTVPVRRAITSSLTWTIAIPASRARSTRSCDGTVWNNVERLPRDIERASSKAWTPSTRNALDALGRLVCGA